MTYEELEDEFPINKKLIDQFLSFLLKTNEKMNLTAITNKAEMLEKHIYDSLLITKVYDFHGKTILDVGSGAGFPGIPLALFYPDAQFFLIDATHKKIKYLNEVINILHLKNVKTICERVENLSNKVKYDVVIARALAKLPLYLKLVANLVKTNGCIIALKGSNGQQELIASALIMKKLNLSLITSQAATLPNKHKRLNFIFKKIK